MAESKKTKKEETVKHESIYEAIAAFQDECPPFVKNIEGYGYTYTGLPEIIKTISPILKKHGLVVLQKNITGEAMIGVHTTVVHIDSGERFESEFITPLAELKGMNIYQSAGAAITYARRYDMSTALGLISEKDDDGGTGHETARVYGSKPIVNENERKKTPTAKKKKRLEKDTEEYDAIVKWLKGGGSIDRVYKRFIVDEETKALLLGIVNEANANKNKKQ